MSASDKVREALAKMTPGEWRSISSPNACEFLSSIWAGEGESEKKIATVFSEPNRQERDDCDGIATLRNETPALLAELDAAKAALREMLDFTGYGELPQPPRHSCGGPTEACDGDCVDFARWSELRQRARAALGGTDG